jgi:hypothetical protein
MKVTELLDSPSPYKVTIDTPTHWSVEQDIGNRKIIIDCEKDSEGIWEFDFYEVDTKGEWATTKTGSGSEFKVGAMVKKAFTEFVNKYHPTAITFAANKEQGSLVPLSIIESSNGFLVTSTLKIIMIPKLAGLASCTQRSNHSFRSL